MTAASEARPPSPASLASGGGGGGDCSLDAALVSCLFITLLASLDGLPATFVFAALAALA